MIVGILGGGQLARMMALAGHPLGIKVIFLDPSDEACSKEVATGIQGDYTDEKQLTRLADQCDVITYEFENVPQQSVDFLSRLTRVHPGSKALATAQDRLHEKNMFQKLGIPTAQFAAIDSLEQLEQAINTIGLPAVLKTRRLGYDGKGQAVLRDPGDAKAAWQSIGQSPAILEAFVKFDREISIIATRSANGETAYYPLTENVHVDGILHTSKALSACPVQPKAEALSETLMTELNYVGVIALELFQQGDKLIANEFAPRVHNSGHWTMEGAYTGQFENHLRAVCDLPLGDSHAVGPSAMVNLVGAIPDIAAILAIPGCHLHLYDKAPRSGRKIGHINICAPDDNILSQRIEQITLLLP